MRKYSLKTYQNVAFRVALRLTGKLGNNGLSQMDLWNYVRIKYNAKSRYDMTKERWIKLAAELKAAEVEPKMLDELCENIKKKLRRI